MMVEQQKEWVTALYPKIPGVTGREKIRAERLMDLFQAIGLMTEDPHEDAIPLVPCDTMRLAAAELRMQGDVASAALALERALAWYRSCPEPERQWHGVAFARTLYEAECWEEARLMFEELAAEQPENISHLGHLGTLAARRGDRSEAERISLVLTFVDPRYLFGAHILWRARIAAQLGDHSRALDLLGEALGQGQPSGVWLLTDPDLDPIRDYPAFRTILAQTG